MKYTQDLRAFGSTRNNEVVITIEDVYKHYYTAYLKSENKFYKFYPTDDWIKQQVWNAENKKMELVSLSGEYTIITGFNDKNEPQYEKKAVGSEWFWKGFYKLYKKTYDIKVSTNVEVSPLVYNSETKSKVPTADTEFTIQGVGASKIRNLIVSCVDEFALEEAQEKKIFDWEEKYDLKNESFKFSVSGEKLETKYVFKSAEAKKAEPKSIEEEIDLEDLPF